MTLQEAAGEIPDGAYILVGGAALHMHPMAFLRELIRQRKRDLTIIGEIQGIEVDLLAGAGSLKRVESSGVGLERFGLARNFRRRVESGELEMADYTDTMSLDRIIAARENFTFWPVYHLGGSDIPKYLPELVPFKCPITGRDLYAMPPAKIDAVVVHMPYADSQGNVLINDRFLMPQGQDVLYTRACNTVYVTVERIVSNAYVRRHSFLNQIPSFRVKGVIEAPWGAHPSSMPDFYDFDTKHMEEYVEASQSQNSFDRYLEKFVLGTPDEASYLERVGIRNLIAAQKVNIR
jgi:glutaconate CoA-transferase subunit A